MWLGITGRNGSGKDSVAKLLSEYGFTPISTSDIIRQEVNKRKLPNTRDSIRKVIEDWRSKYGADILIQKIQQQYGNKDNIVVFSLRHPDEVKTLKRHHEFRLINVITDDIIRFNRAIQRNRENPPKDLQSFLHDEAYEIQRADKRYYDMAGVEKMADITLTNNGTFEDLKKQVQKLAESLKIAL